MKGPITDIHVRQSYYELVCFLHYVGIKSAGPMREDISNETDWLAQQEQDFEDNERMFNMALDWARSRKL